jgi:hypothetical protein
MTRTLFLSLSVAASLLVAAAPAHAVKGRQKAIRTSHTRPDGGPGALGGVGGTNSSQMLNVQRQRAQRGVARQRRMSPRDQLIAARDRQLGRDAGTGFTSRQEAAAYTRTKARLVQIRTFAVAIATGIGGGFFAKMMSAMGALQSGFHNLATDPNFGNPMAQVLDHHFVIGAAIGAGVALVVGSVRAAQLRRRADKIERGELDVDLAQLD